MGEANGSAKSFSIPSGMDKMISKTIEYKKKYDTYWDKREFFKSLAEQNSDNSQEILNLFDSDLKNENRVLSILPKVFNEENIEIISKLLVDRSFFKFIDKVEEVLKESITPEEILPFSYDFVIDIFSRLFFEYYKEIHQNLDDFRTFDAMRNYFEELRNPFANWVDSKIFPTHLPNEIDYRNRDIKYEKHSEIDIVKACVDKGLNFGISWMAVSGINGIGKKKMMLYFAEHNIYYTGWKVLRLDEFDIEKVNTFSSYEYKNNLLVIVDCRYINYKDVVKFFSEVERTKKEKRPTRIMFVFLVDDDFIIHIESRYHKIFRKYNLNSTIVLQPLKSKQMISIIENYCKINNFKTDGVQIKEVLEKSKEWGNTPLVALLLTDALILGKNIKKISKKEFNELQYANFDSFEFTENDKYCYKE